ncbi:unnamed protein product [Closterium sp. Naga37s-1]|nr:unnamed protein product [Closterium sp. Naga37s-1]
MDSFSDAAPSLLAIASIPKQSADGMEQWSLEDLTLGLYRLSLKHAAGKDVDAIPGDVVRNRNDLEEILHWLRWAMSAYETDTAALAKHLKVPPSAIHKHVSTAAVFRPAHYVAVSAEKRCVVVGVRGTSAAADALTDLCSAGIPFGDGCVRACVNASLGHAHVGMLESAKWVAKSQGNLVATLLDQNPGYSLVTVGHSLGAGTAALLAMLLRHPPTVSSLSLVLPPPALSPVCWAYACPSVVSQNLAETSPFLKTAVLQDDVVPRLSLSSITDLRNEILHTDWAALARDNPAASQLASLASGSQSALETSLGISQGQLLPSLSPQTTSWFSFSPAPAPAPAAAPVAATAAAGSEKGGAAGEAAAGAAGATGTAGAEDGWGGWLTYAGSLFTAPAVAAQAESATEAPSAASVPAAATTPAKSIPEASAASVATAAPPVRLVAPGQLFHILRKPPASLQEQFKLPPPPTEQQKHEEEKLFLAEAKDMYKRGMLIDMGKQQQNGDTSAANSDAAKGEATKREAAKADGTTVVPGPAMSHVVVCGADPKPRFRRIILSDALLADHDCKKYGKAIIDAMQWCA